MGKALGHEVRRSGTPVRVDMHPAPPNEGLCARSRGRQARQQAPLDHMIGTQAHSDWKKSGPDLTPDLIKKYRNTV